MDEEIWKDINGTNDKYKVSSYGRVKNKETGSVLKQSRNNVGYLYVVINGKSEAVHRLVCEAFIPNPEHKPEVNHLDEDKENNKSGNLSWVTHAENCNYGTRDARRVMNTDHVKKAEKLMVAVVAKNVNGKEYLFKSIADASLETHVAKESISRCINHKRKTAGDYVWRKATEDDLYYINC